MFLYQAVATISHALNTVMLVAVGLLVNGPYALITTAVSADLGTSPSLQGNSRALATVTAIIDGKELTDRHTIQSPPLSPELWHINTYNVEGVIGGLALEATDIPAYNEILVCLSLLFTFGGAMFGRVPFVRLYHNL